MIPAVPHRNSRELMDAALELVDAARLQSRAELAAAEARVARLKAAAAFEQAGRQDEADRLLAEVRAEQAELEEPPA
jgi:hypothetical protein